MSALGLSIKNDKKREQKERRKERRKESKKRKQETPFPPPPPVYFLILILILILPLPFPSNLSHHEAIGTALSTTGCSPASELSSPAVGGCEPMGLFACSSGDSLMGEPELPPPDGIPAELWCGMFSGRGCCEPMFVTPTSEALPAFERA